jgi:tetratricopeptide (TPR) repeat protein
LALVLKEKGQLEEAIAEYRIALGIKQDYPEAHANLGPALSSMGLHEEAVRECRKAVKLNEKRRARSSSSHKEANLPAYSAAKTAKITEVAQDHRAAVETNYVCKAWQCIEGAGEGR